MRAIASVSAILEIIEEVSLPKPLVNLDVTVTRLRVFRQTLYRGYA
jgi:hypothetical protein